MGLSTVSLDLESQRLGFGYQVDGVVDALLDVEEGLPLSDHALLAIRRTHELLTHAAKWDASSGARARLSATLFFSTAIPGTTRDCGIVEITEAARTRVVGISETLSSVLQGSAPMARVKEARGFFEAVADETLREEDLQAEEEELGGE